MSDKFGRNKSTRWVKASIPTYGDEWGDDYDYDYESGNESEPEHSESQTRTVDGQSASIEEESQPNHPSMHQLDQFDGPEEGRDVQNPNLVLSIDKLRTRRYTSEDSSSDDEEGPEIMDEIDQPFEKNESEDFGFDNNETNVQSKQTSSKNEDKTSELSGMPVNQTITTHNKNYDQKSDLLPPTPTFNMTDKTSKFVGETPKSDRSYQSDADSIQNEPSDLNIRDISKAGTYRDENEYNNNIPVEASYTTQEDQQDKYSDPNDEQLDTQPDKKTMNSNESKSAEAPAPLVLSIDKKTYDDDDNSSDDDWGYNSQRDSDKTDTEDEKPTTEDVKVGSENLNKETDSGSKNKNDALDNLIKDLQNASIVGHKEEQACSSTRNETSGQDELFLNMDSLQNISLPDFENNSFSHYDEDNRKGLNIQNVLQNEPEDDSQPPTPIAPLSFGDEIKGHEDFVSGLTGHRRSIRKPPPGSATTGTNRNGLVSVDYTNIADAVSGYMNDDGSNKNLDLNLVDSGAARLSNVPEGDDNESHDVEADLNPIVSAASSGSLSTGSFSFDGVHSAGQKDEAPKQGDSNKAEEDISRRVSTMSANTISMGNWKPNTSNYRDQFINDNDNESHINFNPYADSNSNYNKFTKMRTVSGASFDSVSNASSVSVPETIDAALPSIDEDPDNHDSTINDSDNSLDLTKTINTTDSVLKEHHYHPQVFKEEKVTPISSKDDLAKPAHETTQKYSSLLASTSDTEDSEITRSKSKSSFGSSEEPIADFKKRLGSASSAGTVSNSTSRNFTPQPYNLYNWKSIMATSQPIDRIRLLKDALEKETGYETGLLNWLNESLKQSEDASNIHIGKIATQAYQNAAHNDIRRHASIRSKVSIVRDKVETSGLQASSLGKRFFNRGKKLMKSGNE